MPEVIDLISTLISSGAGVVAILVGVRALRKGKSSDDDENNKSGKA